MGLKCVRTSSTAFFFFFFNSLTFVYVSIQERCVCFGYFSRKFDCRVVFICLLNELTYFISANVPELKNVIYETFLNERSYHALVKDVCFNFRHENVGKGSCHFSTHGGSVCLWIVNFPVG